ncbi:hypothetical protein Taro_029282 [Colocasia esculenta]|uniref:CTP synthase N-terminal domain-containing protein n=1 Tax=Colocasia esculenta TaxID=4460 RepID=A0A843VKW9_COLES|nr:hypothetical protein [Colocasia esculenta]
MFLLFEVCPIGPIFLCLPWFWTHRHKPVKLEALFVEHLMPKPQGRRLQAARSNGIKLSSCWDPTRIGTGCSSELREIHIRVLNNYRRYTKFCGTHGDAAAKLVHDAIIDPYNTDAGTMSPFEHGEVFVLDDGGEVPPIRDPTIEAHQVERAEGDDDEDPRIQND